MSDTFSDELMNAVKDHFNIPSYIRECADAILSDLLYGPKYVNGVNSENIVNFDSNNIFECHDEEFNENSQSVYSGVVGNTLREYIDELPFVVYYEEDSGYVSENEPTLSDEDIEMFTDDDGYLDDVGLGIYYRNMISSYWKLNRNEIIEALFGKTFSKEFS